MVLVAVVRVLGCDSLEASGKGVGITTYWVFFLFRIIFIAGLSFFFLIIIIAVFFVFLIIIIAGFSYIIVFFKKYMTIEFK